MITSEDILSLNYYTYGNAFTGSYRGMRYRIIYQKKKADEEGNIIVPEHLHVSIWPEPFSYENTKKDLIREQDFSFDEDGRDQALAWINTSWESDEWEVGTSLSRLKKMTDNEEE